MCFCADQSCMCNKQSVEGVRSVRREAKRMHYVEWVWKCECVFELHRTWGYGRLSRQPHACTHRSRCDFMALWLHLRSVFSSVFAPGSSPFFLAPITTTFVIWHRDNETANTATPLRNLRKCIQLFGAFLSVTNCIPKAWHHTPPTENTHCKISSLMLRRLAIIYIVGSKTWEAGGNPPPPLPTLMQVCRWQRLLLQS